MTDKSETERLRELLDERGIEWADQFGPFPVTAYKTHYAVWIAKEYTDGLLSIETRPVTPEQAIAATLGGEDKLLDLAHQAWSITICAMQNMPIPADWGNAVESGLREYGINVDSLPFTTTGSGTCENVAPDYLDFLCSKCGFVHYHSDENDTGDGNDWSYCPYCGKAVKR